MEENKNSLWLPCFLTAYQSIATATTVNLSIRFDNSIEFYGEFLTAIGFQTNSPGTTQYFTINSITIGNTGKQLIYGGSLPSGYFNRSSNTSCVPFPFVTVMGGNNILIVNVTTISTLTDVYVNFIGRQKLVGAENILTK